MIKTILTESGFIENKTFKETRFLKPPKSTYAVYEDAYSSGGADSANLIKAHSYTIEQYSTVPDPESEARLEATFDKYAIPYEKQPRYWIDSEQLWQVVYTFDHIEKIGG